MSEKEKAIKLERRLEQRKLTIQEAVQEQLVLEWLKTSNPAFLSMLTAEAVMEVIQLVIVPGPPQDKIRSYKVPMIAAELLSTMIPKVYELLFLQDPEEKGAPVLARLLKYFDTAPNYVISGYTAKILMNLFPANPSRVLEFILRSQPQRMLNFVESQSIAELLMRLIVVEDALLNVQIKERVALFAQILNEYIDNKRTQDQLSSISWMLIEAMSRLWSQKHKELGRFSGTLFRLVEAVIDQNSLYQQESMLIAVCKQVSAYQKQAPFLIAAIYKKIYAQLSLGRSEWGASKPRLTTKRYKFIQALFFVVAQGSEAIAKQLNTQNVFSLLLDYILPHQWHSLALIEIEKVLKAALVSPTEPVLAALSRAHLPEKLRDLARVQQVEQKKGCGFSGMLDNLAKALKQTLDDDTGFGGWLRKNQAEGDLSTWLTDFLGRRGAEQQGLGVVHEVTKPFYSVGRLPLVFKAFFDETEAINARLQCESPSKHQESSEKVLLEEIEKQNELVYKLMSQLTNQVIPEDKKSEEGE